MAGKKMFDYPGQAGNVLFMPAAFLPSPASDIWHLGPLHVGAFALCMVAGVLAGLWLTDWRYRRAGGQPGVILNVATVAVPVGIIGARIYSVLTNYRLYFDHGRDWVDVFRVWDGGLGVGGAVAAGALATWAYCRRNDIEIGPLAVAAAPALPLAQAIAVWGNWFSQGLYGKPSGLPWAVQIAPSHRASGYQAAATFQPIFLYESLLYLLVAVAVGYAIRRFSLTGNRAFALYAGLYATARFFVEAQRVGYTPRLFGLRTNELFMLVILLAAWSYLIFLRHSRRPVQVLPIRPPGPVKPLRPRSNTAAAQVGTSGSLAVADAAAGPGTAESGVPESGVPEPGAAGTGTAEARAKSDEPEPAPGLLGPRPSVPQPRRSEEPAAAADRTGPEAAAL
jgi:prolipoprotein diacylglyceryl transferase